MLNELYGNNNYPFIIKVLLFLIDLRTESDENVARRIHYEKLSIRINLIIRDYIKISTFLFAYFIVNLLGFILLFTNPPLIEFLYNNLLAITYILIFIFLFVSEFIFNSKCFIGLFSIIFRVGTFNLIYENKYSWKEFLLDVKCSFIFIVRIFFKFMIFYFIINVINDFIVNILT